jgi:hypothetical protein
MAWTAEAQAVDSPPGHHPPSLEIHNKRLEDSEATEGILRSLERLGIRGGRLFQTSTERL